MTFIGTAAAGSTCEVIEFRGRVEGLSGVERFRGPGLFGLVHEFLYDAEGNVVGADQPQVLTNAVYGGAKYSHVDDCATEEGFSRSLFSSTVELF
jgi:hypothetical protein